MRPPRDAAGRPISTASATCIALALPLAPSPPSRAADPYINECLAPLSIAGYIDYRVYADWYYGYTFNYTRQVNGPHCLIWSRPVDSYPLILNLSAFIEFSPK